MRVDDEGRYVHDIEGLTREFLPSRTAQLSQEKRGGKSLSGFSTAFHFPLFPAPLPQYSISTSMWSKTAVTHKSTSVILGLSERLSLSSTERWELSQRSWAGETKPETVLPTTRLQDPRMSIRIPDAHVGTTPRLPFNDNGSINHGCVLSFHVFSSSI
jgi:hypothetical protein